jgi:holin-like protein
MIGLAQLLLWQLLGELLSMVLLPSIPGPVLGLTGLLVFLIWRKSMHPSLQQTGAFLRQHLGLLFVPAAAGIVTYLPLLKQHLWAYLASLFISMVLTVAATGLLLKYLARE